MNELSERGFSLIIKGHKPLCPSNKGLITYHKHALYILNGTDIKKLADFKASFKDKLMSTGRVLERMTRSEPQTAVADGDALFVARRHSVEKYSLADGSLLEKEPYRKDYIHTDRLTVIKGVKGFDDCIAYGEYFSNSKHEEVCVFTKKREGDWTLAYTFPADTVRHIHSLVPDVANGCVYILTGDADRESGIWRATDNFASVEPLLVGNQDYRACIAFLEGDGMTYTTDIPSRQNHITRLDLKNGSVRKLMPLPGSCTVGCRMKNRNVFCTSVEAKEPQNRGRSEMIKYMLRRKLADGMLDDCPRLYVEDKNGGYVELLKCKKDFWPGGLCRFGRILPLYDENTDTLYVFPIAVKKYDGKLYAAKGEELISKVDKTENA